MAVAKVNKSIQKTNDIRSFFTQSDEPAVQVKVADIPDNLGQNFESYGFQEQGEVILFNLRDMKGQPIIMQGKLTKTQKNDSVLVYCTRINPNGKERKSYFNLNALIVEDVNRQGYGKGYDFFKKELFSHKERAEYIFGQKESVALKCTNVVDRQFTKFENGAPVKGESDTKKYYEYEII